MPDRPVLYSFRRCPYAIRARIAIAYAGVEVTLREVLLRDKPSEMLSVSAKGTVPVLVLPDGEVIDESIDVMHWALDQGDPDQWLTPSPVQDAASWIAANDGPFKHWLDRYKYADRHPEQSASWYRDQAGAHLARLDEALNHNPWLHGEKMGLVDVAVFPFVRQFAMVDYDWFARSPYPALGQWLERWLQMPLFLGVMHKYPRWTAEQVPVIFPSAPPQAVSNS